MNTETIKPHILRDEMIFMHCWLYIKQKIYLGFFRVPVVTQLIVKSMKKNLKKVPFLKVYHFFISQHFSNAKVVVVQAVIA